MKNRFEIFTDFELKIMYQAIFIELRDMYIKDNALKLIDEIKAELNKRLNPKTK